MLPGTLRGCSKALRLVAGALLPLSRVLALGCAVLTGSCQVDQTLGGRGVPETFRATRERTNSAAEKILYSFQDGSDGAVPMAGLMADEDGNLYGTADNSGGAGECSVHCGTVFELSPPATQGGRWKFAVLYSFKGGKDGGLSAGNLFFGPDGSLFGTTVVGGAHLKYNGKGVVFQLKPSGSHWSEKVLHRFGRGIDGTNPHGGVVADPQGNLYGTTTLGGPGNCLGGCGNVYELSPPAQPGGIWTETILHSFAGGSDGSWPAAGLAIDRAGRLYGTTEFGGFSSTFCGSGCGTVFELSPPVSANPWTYAVIHRFVPGSAGDGALPLDPLTFDASGDLYGTTLEGRPRSLGYGGIAFELKPPPSSGQPWKEVVLYDFPQYQNDAAYSHAGLIFDHAGNLYGTSQVGGSPKNVGTAFKLVPPSGSKRVWTDLILYRFTRAKHAAIYPSTNLTFGAAHLLYGTTPEGGTGPCIFNRNMGCGTIFEVKP
jgi:hypothetical protein